MGRLCVSGAVAVGVTVVAALVGPASPASSKPKSERDPVTVVASGLNGPFGVRFGGGGLYVAETETGEVKQVNRHPGATTTVVTGLLSPASVDRVGNQLVVVTGGSEIPDASITGDAAVLVARPGEAPTVLADLEAYELANNPDGQLQFDPATNEPLDALSNPFSVLAQRGSGYVLVADAGANVVLSVSRTGEVSTFFVPPLVTTGACEGAPNNDPEHVGCDPVPTGLAYGPGNTLYVSTLSGGVPGEGRVYVLDARTGEVRDVIGGFSGPTGVAVAPNGTVYVSEVFHGAPEGPPPDDFDPSTIGRIVRVDRDGARSYVQVTMPTGLDFHGGVLYASAWSVAGFLGIPDAGQVVAVRPSAFSSSSSS